MNHNHTADILIRGATKFAGRQEAVVYTRPYNYYQAMLESTIATWAGLMGLLASKASCRLQVQGPLGQHSCVLACTKLWHQGPAAEPSSGMTLLIDNGKHLQ